jgi:MFS family permease
MSAATSEELLALYDDAPLNTRYWVTFAIMRGVFVLDFFDFFLIAFVMSQIGPEWKLTYGQGALILYGAGVGAIAVAIIWGALGDRFGRKVQTATGTIICAAGDGRGGVPGICPARCADAVGLAGLPVPGRRDAWPSDRTGARGAGVATGV